MMSLEEAGFAAEGAEDASRALVYMDQQQAIDALITDFTMPGMTGLDLIREVRRRKPTLPTILLTGHGFAPAEQAPDWGVLSRDKRDIDGPAVAISGAW